MEESNVIELLDEIMEEMEGVVSDNVVTITTELIKRSCGTTLSDAQVEQCIRLCASGDTQFFEDLLEKNGITKSKLQKIDKCASIISSIGDVKSLCENIYSIFDMVKKYASSGDITLAASVLSKSLSTLGDAIGLFADCPFVSDILSLGADILDKGVELVEQRAELYDELDAILDSVMNGTSTCEQETQVKTMYATVKDFEESGCNEAIKLYKALMNEYSWLFTLAGVDTTKLNEYNVEITSIQNTYNDFSSKMSEIEKIDIDHDGIISNQEIDINVQQIETSEKSQQYDPLILDLNKNGKFTSDTENGVHFDYSGDGFAEKTAWVEEGDGLLVYDKNGNGTIDDGTELFGDKTIMQNGSVASNGFEALGDLDSNGDQKISSEDTLFDQLQVWIDTNNDGISQQEELYTLSDLGIKELSISTKAYNTTDENGNIVAKKSSFTYEDGTLGDIAELNFDISSSDTVSKNDIEVSEEIKNGYPQLIPSGNMLNLHEAMSIDEELYKLVQEFVNEDEMHNLERLQAIYNHLGKNDIHLGKKRCKKIYFCSMNIVKVIVA